MDDVWQIPQGGIDDQETPDQALKRELFEEIGASNFIVLARLPEPIRYEWPARLYQRGYRGQEQVYFLVQLALGEVIRFDATDHTPEFDAYDWISPDLFLQRTSGFKQEAYTKALSYFQRTYPELLKPEKSQRNDKTN